MTNINRRNAIGTMGLGLAGAALIDTQPGAVEAPSPASPAFAGGHQPRALTFNPANLTGLSERLVRSHYDNNYIGSVRTLNMIEGRLATAMADPDLPPVVYGGLKREELHRTGSVILHEVYFEGLGGNGERGGTIADALAASYGGLDAWEAEFRRTAMSLAGGSGWCVLTYNRHTSSLHNYWAWDHMHGAVTGEPLIALDMYEHAFHMDYGTQAARYVDAFMANLDWEVIDGRYQAATG